MLPVVLCLFCFDYRVLLNLCFCCGRAGKLKDLGNTLLGKVGLSLDNFKAEKDPNTGSYSINFSQ